MYTINIVILHLWFSALLCLRKMLTPGYGKIRGAAWLVLVPFSFALVIIGTHLLYGQMLQEAQPPSIDIVHYHTSSLKLQVQMMKEIKQNHSTPTVESLNSSEEILQYHISNEHQGFKGSPVYPKTAMVPTTSTSASISSQMQTTPMTRSAQVLPMKSNPCDVSAIKTWNEGVVTRMQPPIKKNCKLLQAGSRSEVTKVRNALKSWTSAETENEWIRRMSDCSQVVEEFSHNFYVSQEERDFPIAYIFVVYTNARQVVRLLKAIYRPQNLYCIHPDAKQGEEFASVFRQISRCLENVFVASKLEKVYYQHHTIMDSQLNCMEDLMKYESSRWVYVINLCGRELPLKTNQEIVKSLKRLNGASAVVNTPVSSKGYITKDRFTNKAVEDYVTGKLHYIRARVGPPPHHIKLYKSTNFVAITRPFVKFILHGQKAIDFRNYLKDVKIPEEEFFASLAELPGVPGGNPPPEKRVPMPVIDQYIWLNKYGQPRKYKQSCYGRHVHFVCILTVGDLPEIYRLGVNNPKQHFFFNKYFMEDDHVVMDCMEQRLLQQNMLEYKHDCSP